MEAPPEAGQTGTGQSHGLRVTVDTHERELGEAAQGPLRVPAHTQGGVDHDRLPPVGHGLLQGGRQEVQAAPQEDGGVEPSRQVRGPGDVCEARSDAGLDGGAGVLAHVVLLRA